MLVLLFVGQVGATTPRTLALQFAVNPFLRTTNPDSNSLVFLYGIASFEFLRPVPFP